MRTTMICQTREGTHGIAISQVNRSSTHCAQERWAGIGLLLFRDLLKGRSSIGLVSYGRLYRKG